MTQKYKTPDWLLDGTPRPVQLEALRRSYFGYALMDGKDAEPMPRVIRANGRPATGWGHFMEMRLGKTPTTLNEIALFIRDHGFTRAVVISPNSYKEDWKAECIKYGLSMEPYVYQAIDHDRIAKEVLAKKDGVMLIVNYEALKSSHIEKFVAQFIDQKTYFVVDESIKIKNPESLQTKAVHRLSLGAKVVRELTGLPMTQGPHDLFSQLRTLRAIPGKNYYAFRNNFCKMGGYKNKVIKGVKNEEELNRLIGSTAFLAKRKDWMNYKDPEFYNVRLNLDPVQQKHYKEIDKEFVTLLEDGTEVTVEQVITKMMKLQQISSGFLYLPEGKAVELMDMRKTPKIIKLLELLEDEIPGKIVVPYHYSKSGQVLLEVLTEAGYNPAAIFGGLQMDKMGKDVVSEKRKFNNDPSCRVMVLQIVAGKYGHDLSGVDGARVEHMVFYENTYSLDDRTQIEMRISGGDNQNWNNVYMDFVSSEVEKNATKALAKKQSVVNAVIGSYRNNTEKKEH